jgi:hypothetical protein
LTEAASIFMDAYERGPAIIPIESLLSRLGEIDSQYIDLLIRQLQNQSVMMDYTSSEETRLRTVWASREKYDSDSVVEAIVDMWTDFGFGLNIEIIPQDEPAVEVWDEFWHAPENSYLLSAREIYNLSKTLLVDGDFLLVYFTNTMTGETTLRRIKTDKIRGGPESDGIIALPDDATVPVLYCRDSPAGDSKQNFTTQYYIDWRADVDMVRQVVAYHQIDPAAVIDEQNSTRVRAMLVAHRVRNRRGWPLLTTGLSWVSTYSEFLQARAAVARAVSMYVDKIVAKGGQRAIDQIKARLQSSLAVGDFYDTNPRPASGSTWIENEALTRERMNLSTGGVDAEKDGAMLMGQAGLAGRIYPHWLGRGDAYRLATASAMETPVQRAFNRYQGFWSSVWQDMATYVLSAHEWATGEHYSNYDITASTDALITTDVASVQQAIDAFCSLVDRALVAEPVSGETAEALLRVLMQTVGVADIEDILAAPLDDTESTTDDSIQQEIESWFSQRQSES